MQKNNHRGKIEDSWPHRLDVDLTAGHPAGEPRLKSPVSGSQLAPWLSRDARLFSFGGRTNGDPRRVFSYSIVRSLRDIVTYVRMFSSPRNVNIRRRKNIAEFARN